MIETALQVYRLQSSSKQALRAFEEWFAMNRSPNSPLELRPSSGEPIPAYVNASRWVITCPVCSAGSAVLPAVHEAACLECGLIHRVKVPDEKVRAVAEALLMKRPRGQNRNWFPFDTTLGARTIKAETVDMLRLENALILKDDLLQLVGENIVKELGPDASAKLLEGGGLK